MGKTTKVAVKKEIYIWGIKESGKDLEEIKTRFNNIEDWINQKSKPTFRQLEKLANYLKVPFGYMFLDKPPSSDIVQTEFRTIGNKIPNISKNLKDTIYEMSRKQDWISEYRKENGWDKIIVKKFNEQSGKDYVNFAKSAKGFIDLDEFWYKKFNDNRISYNFLRKKIEDKGIIVMQNGIVKANTHRKLELCEFRGFMLYDDFAPLIFINSNDSYAGKIFTLIHEYIHTLFEKDDVFINEDLDADNKLEKYINKITAEFLMPKSHVKDFWDNTKKNLNQIENISKIFNVSKLALSIRLKELGLIDQSLVKLASQATEKDLKNKTSESKGGNYWTNYKSRYSNTFVETVIEGAESGNISHSYAFNLLNVKAKGYDVLKEDMMPYG